MKHPVPLLPNIRLESSSSDFAGDAELTKTITFLGIDFTLSQNVHSEYKMSRVEVIPYYNIFDFKYLSLDAGVDIRLIEGEVTIGDEFKEVDATLPLGYLAVETKINDFVSINGQLKYLKVDENEVKETSVGISYKFFNDFALDIKATEEKIDVDIDDTIIQTKEETTSIGISYRF